MTWPDDVTWWRNGMTWRDDVTGWRDEMTWHDVTWHDIKWNKICMHNKYLQTKKIDTNARIGHTNCPVLWCIQRDQPDDFIGSPYLKSNRISFCCVFLWFMYGVVPSHSKKTLALARSGMHWGNPCCLSGGGFHWKPSRNSHRLKQKETRRTSEAKQPKGKT